MLPRTCVCLQGIICLLFILQVKGDIYERSPHFTKEKMRIQFITKPVGATVFLQCSAEGKPMPNITWLKDNQIPKRQMGYKIVYRKFSMRLEDVVPSDRGNYTCIVTNEYGSINFTYTVDVVERLHGKPLLQPDLPKNLTLVLGETAKFECGILSDLQYYIQWLKHYQVNGSYTNELGSPYFDVIRTDDLNVINPQVLLIENITYEDAGWYTCLAGNTMGISHQSAYLTVLPRPPHFRKKKMRIQFITKPVGGTLFLQCPAEGKPMPNITWLKDNQIPKRRMGYKIIYRKFSMRLEDVVPSDRGNYTCIVTNEYGSINFTYTVDVVEGLCHKPLLQPDLPKNLTLILGEMAKFECRILSDLQPYIYWLKHYKVNGSYTDELGSPYFDVIQTDDLKVTDPQVLLIENITYEDAGWYTCLAGNSMRISLQSAYLTVLPGMDASTLQLTTWKFMP